MRKVAWHGGSPAPLGAGDKRWLFFLIGLSLAGLFWWMGRHWLGGIAAGVTVASAILGVVWPAGYTRWMALLNGLGFWLMRAVTFVLLVPIYLLIFPVVRVFARLAGRDPLLLRAAERLSYWEVADANARKVKQAARMFATERRAAGGRVMLPLIGFTVLVLVAAEVGLRAFGFGHNVLYVNDPMAGYYPLPNQRTHRLGTWITINNYGMRAPDVVLPKPPGRLRILMLGDSTLYGGSYVTDEELYARQLEKLLGSKVEVLNMGVNGWGPYHKLGYVQKFGTFEADVAVICLPLGDLGRPLFGLENLPYMAAGAPPKLAWEEVFFHLTWRYRANRMANPPNYQGPPTVIPAVPQEELGVEKYIELARTLRKNGAEVLFAVLPYRDTAEQGTMEPWPEQSRKLGLLKKALEQENIPMDHAVGAFKGQGDIRRLYHDQVHLDVAGHTVYSRHLQQFLLQQSRKVKTATGATAKVTGP